MNRSARTSTTLTASRPDALFGLGFEDDDPKHVRWAMVIAIGLHLVLFSLNLPGMPARVEPEKREPHFLVQQPPWQPPLPEQQQVIPEQAPLRVPIPDPTPDGPESIRPPTKIEVPIALIPSDVLTGIPDAPPAPDLQTPLRVGGEVEPPVKIYAPPPSYTEIARYARIEGTVILETVIDTNGFVTNAKVLKALPLGLDRAAVEAVETWRFEPGTLRGEPVAVFYYLTVRFELH